MGRIKTKLVKSFTNELFEKHKGEFTEEYDKNKELVGQYANIPSRKLNNIISGYITKLVKLSKKEK